MANITVTATPVDVNVSTTLSNIVVTDVETNQSINVTTTLNSVAVTSSPVNVTVSPGFGLSNAEIRSVFSAESPILYDESNGIFSFDSNASFAGKTTDDLTQGVNNIYFSTTGASVNTTNLPEGDNLYYTNARVLSAIENSDVTLKQYTETSVDIGSVFGNVTIDAEQGTLFYGTITGDITGITVSNAQEGTSVTIVLTQDGTGNNDLDTITYPANWNDWYFVNDESSLSLTAASKSYITVVVVDGVLNAAVVGGEPTLDNYVPVNRQVFDGSVVTLSQGPFGGFYANTNLAFGNAYLNTSTGDGSQRFLQSYNNDTGTWSTIDDGALSGMTVVDTGNDEGVVFGRFNPYSASPLGTTNAVIGLKGSDKLYIADLTSNSTIRPAITLSTKVDGTTTFENLKVSVGDAPATERFGVEDNATLGAARFIGNVIIQNSNNQTDTTFKFGSVGNEILQLDHGTANTITARAPLTSNSNITTTANVEGAYFIGDGSNITGISNINNDLTIAGNLDVQGNINYVNVVDMLVDDNSITLNYGNASARDAFIYVDRSGSALNNAHLKWNETDDRWEINDGTSTYIVPRSTSDLAEGTNLYYTTARANAAMDAYLTSITANVDSVNGQTGVVVLDTGDIPENGNLYYTTARANSAIDDYVVGSENIDVTSGVISLTNALSNVYSVTTDGQNFTINTNDKLVVTQVFDGSTVNTANIEGDGYAFFKGASPGGYAGDAFGYSGTADIVNYVIFAGNTTSGSNAITGVDVWDYLVNAQLNLSDVPANSFISLNEQTTYPFPAGTRVTSVDAANSTVYMSANATATVDLALGSDAWFFHPALHDSETGLTVILFSDFDINGDGTVNTSLNAWGNGQTIQDLDLIVGPVNNASVDVNSITMVLPASLANGTAVTISGASGDPANANVNGNVFYTYFQVDTGESFYTLYTDPGLTTEALYTNAWSGGDLGGGGFLPYEDTWGGSAQYTVEGNKTLVLADNPFVSSAYGYPITGPVPSNFDIITAGSSTDYTVTQANIEDFMIGRTKLTAPRTVLQAPRGLIVGENADLTNRAENDRFPSFGVNVLWDGTSTSDDYAKNVPVTQILVKNYTDNNLQGGDETQRSRFGPRLFFTASEGNALEPFSVTYPRENLELGRIAWWGPSSTNPGLGTSAPSGWISGVTSQDYTVRNSGLGMYFGVKHNVNNNNSSIWAGQKNGQTLLAGGYTGNSTANITLAPLDSSISNGNSVAMFNAGVTNKLFANVGYANMSSQTGSRLTVTNGSESTNPGDFVIEIDRNVLPPGIANVAVDADFGIVDGSIVGGPSDHAFVFIAFSGQTSIAPTTTAITFNNVTGDGAANINGQTFYINNSQDPLGGGDAYYLFTDSGLTTPALMSTLGALSGSTGSGYFEYTLTVDSVSKNWSIELEEANEDLKFKSDGNTVVTFTDSGNINLATNASINYDEVYGCWHKTANVTAAAADTPYEFDWTTDTTVHAAERISISSNSHIDFAKTGTYELCVQFQIRNDDNALRTAYIWLRKNGSDVEQTTTRLGIQPKGSATASFQLSLLEWLIDANAGDYYEVVFAVDNASGISLEYDPAQVSPYARPAIPSAVLTIKPVGA